MTHTRDVTEPTASQIAELVRTRAVHPAEIVAAAFQRIARQDPGIGAFETLREARALREAQALAGRDDLHLCPLAGVPVGIKDTVPVAGEPMRNGSRASPAAPRSLDHEAVRRLRSAGAIVVGTTRVPELCVWGTSDNAFGTARNPWDPRRSAGGSSGGSAAAVASGMVPATLGADGLGSIRIPAATCGIVGLKPGRGLVPAQLGTSSWWGLAENGPMTTTVADAALMLAVLADRPDLAGVSAPPRALRLAFSTRSPVRGIPVDRELRAAVTEAARRLQQDGHEVEERDPPPVAARHVLAVMARWTAGTAQEAGELDARLLERRTRAHVRIGRLAAALRLVRDADRAHWEQLASRFFGSVDALITPVLAAPALTSDRWSERGWIANVHANLRFAPFTPPWNLAGCAAAAIPAGIHSEGTPMAVQIIAPAGCEATVLQLAWQLEALQPWLRHAPVPP